MSDDDDILEISAEDLAEEGPNTSEACKAGDVSGPPRPDTGDAATGIRPLLDISLEDLSDDGLPAIGALPAVTEDQLLAARSSITLRTLCSSTGRPFDVRYVEDKPGVFKTAQVTVPEPGASPAGPAGATGQVEGTFEVSPDYACPFCGSTAVLVCGQCGVDLCAGTGQSPIVCPQCHSQIQIGGKATTATGLLGGKGKT